MTQSGAQELHPEILAWKEAGDTLRWPQGDCLIFYRDIGSADAAPDKTLMLLHGFPESSFSYHKVIERLSTHFDRIVLADFPGFGLSDKPVRLTYSLFEQTDALLFVWEQLGVSGGHVLAHDMGDTVLTELVARSVQNLLPAWFEAGLRSVTFTDGNMVMEESDMVLMQHLLRHHVVGPQINRLTNARLFANQVKRANGLPLEADDINKLWQLNTLQDGHRLAWKLIRYLDERDRFQNPRWLPALSRFDGPTHLCWGAEDRASPPRVAERLKRDVCPDARLTLMDGVGHFCQIHAPEQWSDAVLDFHRALDGKS